MSTKRTNEPAKGHTRDDVKAAIAFFMPWSVMGGVPALERNLSVLYSRKKNSTHVEYSNLTPEASELIHALNMSLGTADYLRNQLEQELGLIEDEEE